MKEFRTKDNFIIEQRIAELSHSRTWATRLNLVKFGAYPAKHDLRKWQLDENGMEISAYRGISLTVSELRNLRDALNKIDLGENRKGGDENAKAGNV